MSGEGFVLLTSNTCEELSGKALDLAVRERNEGVALEEIKDALIEQVHDDADVTPVVEAISKMDASVPVLFIVGLEGGEDTELDP